MTGLMPGFVTGVMSGFMTGFPTGPWPGSRRGSRRTRTPRHAGRAGTTPGVWPAGAERVSIPAGRSRTRVICITVAFWSVPEDAW